MHAILKDYDRVEETWAELGRKIRPLGDNVFVRTELLPEKIGRIYIPPSKRGNYSGLAHSVFMRAVVLSVGPKVHSLSSGDVVCFARLFFGRWEYGDDKTLIGWVREPNIQAFISAEETVEERCERVARYRKDPPASRDAGECRVDP